MNKKVEVTNIDIKIGEQDISLSLKEAKELKDLLNEVLGENEIIYLPTNPTYPPYRYIVEYPHYTDIYDVPVWETYGTWNTSNTSEAKLSISKVVTVSG